MIVEKNFVEPSEPSRNLAEPSRNLAEPLRNLAEPCQQGKSLRNLKKTIAEPCGTLRNLPNKGNP